LPGLRFPDERLRFSLRFPDERLLKQGRGGRINPAFNAGIGNPSDAIERVLAVASEWGEARSSGVPRKRGGTHLKGSVEGIKQNLDARHLERGPSDGSDDGFEDSNVDRIKRKKASQKHVQNNQ
jgi:hypothetical protein